MHALHMLPSAALASAVLLGAIAPGEARAESIPDASYEISLPPFDIQLRDYAFPSGLRIIFQEEHSQPVVAITNVIDHGSGDDQPDNKGIAHLVEHLNFRARHGDLPKNMDFIKQLGGSFNAYTSWDRTVYMTVAPRDALVPLLRLEALRLTDSLASVTDVEIDVEREVVRNELRQNYENTDNAIGDAWPALSELLFPPGHPYHISTIGTHEGIDASDLAACKEYTDLYYRPSEATIVVAGDFSLDESGDFINQAFGDLPHLLADPDDPDAELTLVEPVERITGDPPPVVEPYQLGPVTVEGLVDETTVVVGWPLPAGFRGSDNDMLVATGLIQSALTRHFNPEWDPLQDEITWVGCFPNQGRYASLAACYIEPRAGMTPEKTVEEAKDGLYLAWYQSDPNEVFGVQIKQIQEWSFRNQKSSAMADVLRTVDDVASLYGRATSLATHAHYTASPMYFHDTFEDIQRADMYRAQEMARQYLTRDRMAAVIVKPMSDEEKARREAAVATGSGDETYHGTQSEEAYELVFDAAEITPEAIERVTITPSRDKIRELDLDNGMHVTLMSHGNAPIARVGLYLDGHSNTSKPAGLDWLAEELTVRGHRVEPTDDLGQVAGAHYDVVSGPGRLLWAEGPTGNVDALLRRIRQEVEQIGWRPAQRNMAIKLDRKAILEGLEKPEGWAINLIYERLFGTDHPLGTWEDAEFYEAARDWPMDEVKTWMLRKYQPANTHLIVVGDLEHDAMEESVRRMFTGWEAHDDAGDPPPRWIAPTDHVPERTVLVFDKEGSNQSEISLVCPAGEWTTENVPIHYVLGDVLSEQLWRTLREQEGLTYGAYFYDGFNQSRDVTVVGYTLVQADATAFAVDTFLDILARTQQGEVDPLMLASAKWSEGRKYMLGYQSGSGMLSGLNQVYRDFGSYEWYDTFPTALASVEATDFQAPLEECLGHEVITVVGPAEIVAAQLKERDYAHEIIDWEALYEGQLTPKELKKHLKAKEKAEREKAEEEAAEAGE